MAADKLVDSAQLDGALTSTADSIRAITGKSNTIAWDEDDGFKNELDTIAVRSASNLTVDGPTVIVPGGYYRSNVSKSVDSGSVVENTPTINNATGVVTGSATVTEGYVTASNPSKALQLTTQEATTYNTSATDQTIGANRWLTGDQTIKAVKTSGITADNIKSGTAVQVGDTNDSDRIIGVTGTFTASNTVSSGQTAASASQIRAGYSAWVDGAEVKGSIGSKAATTYNVSTSNQTIAAGQYLSGAQTFRGVTTANISAENIKKGVTINVGDAGSATRITSVAGTYTSSDTVSSGQTAANAGKILSGYSAWVDGGEVKGSIGSKGASTYNTSTSDQTISAGQYLSGAQTFRGVTTANIAAGNIKKDVVIKVGDAGSATRIANVTGTFTSSSTVSTGQTAAAAGQLLSGYSAWVNGAEIKGSIGSKGAATYNTSTSNQSISAGQYLSGAQTFRAVTTANISAGNIKSGVTITVGDAGSATRIANVAGTFTASSTVSSGQAAANAGHILSGRSAWVDGAEVKGSIASLGAATYNTSTSDQTIAAGKYLSGAQTIRKVTTANISAGNIKTGVTIQVGDAGSETRIANVAGTFTASNTVSSGQTAAAAGQILSGYSAWVGGSEIKGSIATKTSSNMTVSGASVTAVAGYYASNQSKSVASGSATTPATTVTVAPSISIDSAGKITASNSGTKSVTPTVSAGYVSAGTAGTITVNGSNTKQMTTKGATTYNISTSDQSIASGTYLTGAQTFRKITTANISAGNIKKGVTITVGDSGSSTRIANVTGTYAGYLAAGTCIVRAAKGYAVYETLPNISSIGSTNVSIPAGTYHVYLGYRDSQLMAVFSPNQKLPNTWSNRIDVYVIMYSYAASQVIDGKYLGTITIN